MKSFIAIVALSIFSTACHAQNQPGNTDPISFTAHPPITAQDATSKSNRSDKDIIMDKLSVLKLSAEQKANIGDAVQSHLDQKDAPQSAEAQTSVSRTKFFKRTNPLTEKMKSLLSEEQYNMFLEMKPKEEDTTNPLYKIFY